MPTGRLGSRDTGPSLHIDAWMPAYDYVERHATSIRASPSIVYEALMAMDASAHPVVRLLLALRALPARIARRPLPPGWLARHRLTLRDAPAYGFAVLDEDPPREIVLGISGRFWQLAGGVIPTIPAEFCAGVPAGTARAAWSFALAPGGNATVLSTETRIRCADAAARRTFGRYWRLVHPGSALIRCLMLRAVKRAAESTARRSAPRPNR
jgi:hypothetical protein